MAANTFTEFYCQTTGSNLNAGSTTSDAAVYTSTNGNWDGTSIFTPTDGSTPASSVSVGDWISVFLDAATVAVYIARVTAVAAGVNGAITLSTTAKSGTAPASGATGRTVKAGGAWKGPNAADGFPFTVVQSTMTNTAGNCARINIKGGTTYSITAAITQSNNGPMIFSGYTTTPGDMGRWTLDGGTSGASYVLLTQSGTDITFTDAILQNNGATGVAQGFATSGGRVHYSRVTVQNVRGSGFILTGDAQVYRECYATGCNQSNGSNGAGFFINGAAQYQFIRCVSRANAGSNSCGWNTATGNQRNGTWWYCISAGNGNCGLKVDSGQNFICIIKNCDFYGNTGSGVVQDSGTGPNRIWVENSNFVSNGAYGIEKTDAASTTLTLVNCGFFGNTSGEVDADFDGCTIDMGRVSYASTPYQDPSSGNFRIILSTAKNAGRAAYGDYTLSTSYEDIGAVGGFGKNKLIDTGYICI